jgi:hypothetical protein
MKIRDRIKSLRRVRAGDLAPNPKNWRRHPERQHNALRGILSEVGFADAVLARETKDGLVLLDGHLRAEITSPDQKIPVLVLDVTEEEGDKLLATLDPLAALAETDTAALEELAGGCTFASDDLSRMLSELSGQPLPTPTDEPKPAGKQTVPELWQVIASCDGEDAQKLLYERLKAEGYPVKLLRRGYTWGTSSFHCKRP